MNVLEVFGLAFIALVLINLNSMVRAIKNARQNEKLSVTKVQEV
jgi:hypothetical protein